MGSVDKNGKIQWTGRIYGQIWAKQIKMARTGRIDRQRRAQWIKMVKY